VGEEINESITAQQNMNKHKTCLLISDSSLRFLNEYLFWPKDKGIEPQENVLLA
jgi:hypothetical protein